MVNKRVRMVVEFSVDEEVLREKGITFDDVVNGIKFNEHDAVDGFEITTDVPGCDCTSNFFLCGGDVVSIEEVEAFKVKRFKSNEECALALFEYLKAKGSIEGAEYDRETILHDINNLRGREWLDVIERNINTKPFFDYINGAEYPWDEFVYGSGIAPDVFLKAVLNEDFPENTTFEEVRSVLDKNGYKELWDYPTDEIDEVLGSLSEDLWFIAVDFYEGGGHFARIFEITQEMADRFESFLVETERGDTVLPCHVRPDDRIIGPYKVPVRFEPVSVTKLVSDAQKKANEFTNNGKVIEKDDSFLIG